MYCNKAVFLTKNAFEMHNWSLFGRRARRSSPAVVAPKRSNMCKKVQKVQTEEFDEKNDSSMNFINIHSDTLTYLAIVFAVGLVLVVAWKMYRQKAALQRRGLHNHEQSWTSLHRHHPLRLHRLSWHQHLLGDQSHAPRPLCQPQPPRLPTGPASNSLFFAFCDLNSSKLELIVLSAIHNLETIPCEIYWLYKS